MVIDPVSAYLGGTDSHRNAEVRALGQRRPTSIHGVSLAELTSQTEQWAQTRMVAEGACANHESRPQGPVLLVLSRYSAIM